MSQEISIPITFFGRRGAPEKESADKLIKNVEDALKLKFEKKINEEVKIEELKKEENIEPEAKELPTELPLEELIIGTQELEGNIEEDKSIKSDLISNSSSQSESN